MTGPTREEINDWRREAEAVASDRAAKFRGIYKHNAAYMDGLVDTVAALAFAAGSRSSEDARDAARYRWLRNKARSVDWSRYNAGGGHTSWHRIRAAEMDADIDAAMGGNDA